MPSFFRVFRRDPDAKSKKNVNAKQVVEPPKPKWEDSWSRKDVQPEDVQELIHVCTHEMKSRALDMPFLLLPFRPGLDAVGGKNFIRQYFKAKYEGQIDPTSLARRELMLMEPIVLCSIMKWCWSRLPGGVVTWETYDLFKSAEIDSKMAKNAFEVFIPMSTESTARREIIFDFFDLLAAVAARGKTNGLGGRKLSRYAGWWAFELSDGGKGFDGGYQAWSRAADATSHLFFAYLRSLAPNSEGSVSGISRLPRSLQALLSQTEYPPQTPTLTFSSTPKVVMIVENVSPTPFALLRRARNFEYRDDDRVLKEFSNYDDPVNSLTDECRRVLEAISSVNQTAGPVSTTGAAPDPSWSRFEDLGFSSDFGDNLSSPGDLAVTGGGKYSDTMGPSTNLNRPTTPSWADFLSSGFPDDKSPTLLPPDKQLHLSVAQIRGHSSQSHRPGAAQADLEPGELASIAHFDLDETFWWVWMTSLAPEETSDRKAVFGRCALIEADIRGASWLLIEEQVKGASPDQDKGAYIAEKRGIFSFSRRGRLSRKKTTIKKDKKPIEEPMKNENGSASLNKIGPEQQAKIQQAAAQLAQGQTPKGADLIAQRRSRLDEDSHTKTTSVLTLQPGIMSEAGPALTWAKHFDSGAYAKEDLRNQYLGDKMAGTGRPINGHSTSAISLAASNGAVSSLNKEASSRDLHNIPGELPVELPGDEIQPISHRSVSSLAVSNVQKSRTDLNQPLVGDEKPSLDDHPAIRSPSVPDIMPTPELKPAEVIKPAPVTAPIPAPKTVTPPPLERKPAPVKPSSPKKLQKQPPPSGGFKKLFGRTKKEPPVSNEKALPAIVRKPKSQMIQMPVEPTPEVHVVPAQELTRQMTNPEPTFAEPSLEPSFEPEMATDHINDHVNDHVNDHAFETMEADREFARFDHGPEEMHSYAADDDEDDAAAPPPTIKRAPGNRPAGMLNTDGDMPRKSSQSPIVIPTIANQDIPAHNGIHQNGNGNGSFQKEDSSVSTSDRWAQIRKNAAERAQRLNEESQTSVGGHKRQGSQSNRSDDGETSGEETIESRVARIKARVAELTGNMDSNRP